MSAMEMWQESALVSEPMLHTCKSCTSFTPSILRIAASTRSSFTPRGVPSRRMLSVSRMMPKLDHRIRAPMPNESAGSIQYCPVARIAQPPAITAAVESVSPISCRHKSIRPTRRARANGSSYGALRASVVFDAAGSGSRWA